MASHTPKLTKRQRKELAIAAKPREYVLEYTEKYVPATLSDLAKYGGFIVSNGIPFMVRGSCGDISEVSYGD